MKILYCMNCLAGKGGIERVTIVKANALADIPGNEVAICFTDNGNYPQTIHPVDPRIKVYFLDTPYWNLHEVGRGRLLFEFVKRVKATKRAIERVMAEFRPDVLVNTGSYEKYACALISGGGKCLNVRELHFASNYREIVAKSFTGKLSALSITFFEKFVLSHFFDCSFLLTKQDLKDNYSRYKLFTGKMAVQHNPCSFENECPDDCQRQKKILCVGRYVRRRTLRPC